MLDYRRHHRAIHAADIDRSAMPRRYSARRDNCRSSNLPSTPLHCLQCRKDRTRSACTTRPGSFFEARRYCTPGSWLAGNRCPAPTNTQYLFQPGRRIPIPLRTEADSSCAVFCDSQVTNALASSQLTLMTGRSPRPQSRSSGRNLHPPSSTHLSHSLNVTS